MLVARYCTHFVMIHKLHALYRMNILALECEYLHDMGVSTLTGCVDRLSAVVATR